MTDPIAIPQRDDLLVESEIKPPNCYPLDPDRQAITDAALRRSDGGFAPIFVSWCRPDGGRFAATVIGGFKQAEAFAAAVRRFERPLIVRIGRFAYEGLPPKIRGFVPATPVRPTDAEVDASKHLVLPGVMDRGFVTPLAEGTPPKAQQRAEGPSASERN